MTRNVSRTQTRVSRVDALRIGAHRVADWNGHETEDGRRKQYNAARRFVLDRHEEKSGEIREYSGLREDKYLRVYQVDRGQTWQIGRAHV